MKKTIRVISILGAVACFAISTTDLDIDEVKQDTNEHSLEQTAYHETYLID